MPRVQWLTQLIRCPREMQIHWLGDACCFLTHCVSFYSRNKWSFEIEQLFGEFLKTIPRIYVSKEGRFVGLLKSTKVKSIVEKQKFIYTFILSDILIIKLNKWEQIQIIFHLLLRDQTHLRSNFIARKIFRITFLRLRTRATYGGKG